MTYQFKSEVTAGDFWKLTMSRTYRSVAGVCNMVFTVAMILFTAKFFRTSGDLMQMLMLFGCLLFPVIQPIAIYLKATTVRKRWDIMPPRSCTDVYRKIWQKKEKKGSHKT